MESHIKIKFHVKKLFDGKILPDYSVKDKGVLFYNLVISQGGHQLIKLAFDKFLEKLMVDLFNPSVEIPTEFIDKSMEGTCARLINEVDDVNFHVYKIYVTDDYKMGYVRKFGPHSLQNIPIDSFNPKTPSKHELKKSINITFGKAIQKKFSPKPTLSLNGVLSPSWCTQKRFYGDCHITTSNELQFWDLKEIYADFFQIHKNDNFEKLTDVLKLFGKIISKDIIYKNDYKFENPVDIGDFGDSKPEMSGWGDCEDLACFFMRTFRLLCAVYKWGCLPDSSLSKNIEILVNCYTPLVSICRIFVCGRSEYHSTLLFIPTTESGLKTLSFEVTSPDKTLDLAVKEELDDYNSWHTNHYFLVDSVFITRLSDTRTKIEDLTIEIVKEHAFNY
jgi:hypothetical protein